ncbi:MAG: type II toxin-antitoxin system HicB family antitoxin [Mariprofundales bacterium]
MRYPIAIEPGDDANAFGVVVPDFIGCFSAGDTMDEAIDHTREAVELQMEELLSRGEAIPPPSPMQRYATLAEFSGWLWAVVDVDLTRLRSASKRYNITMPERVMAMVDAAAKQEGESRSGFLARSAVMRIEHAMH